MDVIFQQNKEQWNRFLLSSGDSFLQSWEWGEFQEKLNRKVWRLAIEEGSQVLLQALVIKKPLPLGKSYLYIPFGPCFKQNSAEEQKKQAPLEALPLTGQALELLIGELKKIAKAEKSTYCYVEPFREAVEGPSFRYFRYLAEGRALADFCKPQKRIQPQQTLIIDLLPSEEKIFRNLKSKTTRYNIRFAEKKGVKFLAPKEIGAQEIQIFYDLAQKSAKRDSFVNYPKDYFNKLFSVPSQEMQVKLFFAKHQSNYIAANILVFFGKIAVHLFGGFDHDFRHLMAPYFMHWNQMLFAKNQMNCETYDFWGIDEKKWPGVTHFKRSFGGKEIIYPQGYDIVMDKIWYSVFKAARKFLGR